MKKLSMFKLVSLGYKIVLWYQKASEDDKITKDEILSLIQEVLQPDMFDINIKL